MSSFAFIPSTSLLSSSDISSLEAMKMSSGVAVVERAADLTEIARGVVTGVVVVVVVVGRGL